MQKRLEGQYNLIQKIGQGGYSNVYKATDKDGKIVAIKEIPLANLQKEIIPYMRNEVQLMRTATNKNVIRMIKDFEIDKHLYLILEYCEMDVQQMVRKYYQNQKLPKNLIIVLLRQIVNGITFLHSQNIIHRDLKLENFAVFLDNEQRDLLNQGDLSVFEQATYKLLDLGLAKKLKSQFHLATTWAGTEPYMAPEILLEQVYGFQADMYSLGVCIYQLATGRLPYSCSEPTNIEWIPRQREEARFNLIEDQDLRELVTQMLRYDPKKRISWCLLAQHKYFKIDNNQFLGEDDIILSDNLEIYKDKSEQLVPAQKFNISSQPIDNDVQKNQEIQNQQIENQKFIQDQPDQQYQKYDYDATDRQLTRKIYQMRNNCQLLYRLSQQLEELTRFLRNSRYNYLTMQSTINMYAEYFRYISRQLFQILQNGFQQQKQQIKNIKSQENLVNLIEEDYQKKYKNIQHKCPESKSIGYFFKKVLKQGIDPVNIQTPEGMSLYDRTNIQCYQILIKIVQDTFYQQKQLEGDQEEKTAKCQLYVCLYYLAKSRAIFKQGDQVECDWRKEELWFDEAKQQPDMLTDKITDILQKYGFSYE